MVTIMRLMVTLGSFLGGIDPLNPQAKKFSVARGNVLPAHGSLTASAAGHSGGRARSSRKPGHTGSRALGWTSHSRSGTDREGASGSHTQATTPQLPKVTSASWPRPRPWPPGRDRGPEPPRPASSHHARRHLPPGRSAEPPPPVTAQRAGARGGHSLGPPATASANTVWKGQTGTILSVTPCAAQPLPEGSHGPDAGGSARLPPHSRGRLRAQPPATADRPPQTPAAGSAGEAGPQATSSEALGCSSRRPEPTAPLAAVTARAGGDAGCRVPSPSVWTQA